MRREADLPQRTGGRTGMLGEEGEALVDGVVQLEAEVDTGGGSSIPVVMWEGSCGCMVGR